MQTSLYAEAQPGMGIVAYPNTYIVVDLETTGLNPVNDEIIEISALKYVNNQLVESFTHLVNPQLPINWKITQITGIDDEMVAQAPTIDQLLPSFLEFIGSEILMGYNFNFDISFLINKLNKYGYPTLTNNYIDVMQLAKLHLKNMVNYKQTTIAAYFTINTQGAHRASVDCEMCAACYWKLKELYRQAQSRSPWQATATGTNTQPLAGQSLVLLGELEKASFHCLEGLIERLGGLLQSKVTPETNIVIVGMGDAKVLKQKDFLQAEALKKQGYPLYLLQEANFINSLQKKNYLI